MLLKGKKVLRHIATLLTMAMLIGTTAFASEGETKVYTEANEMMVSLQEFLKTLRLLV